VYPDDIIDTFHPDLQKGQRGCSQSHILIWRHMVEHKLEYALILEDDACFDIHWKDKLNRFHLDSTQKNWHAIFLNASEPLHEIDKWSPALNQFLTGGYILSYTGATILLNTFQGCYHTSDWMTSRLQLLGNCYTYFPWLIIQEGTDSTIGSGVEADHEKVVRCLSAVHYSLDHYK
jgi:GR25 family glycosyltransferase involved in LPS biosynthesis